MSGRLSAGGYFKPPGRAIEGVCWKCRLQLQRRGLHAARPARFSQTISANEDNRDGLRPTGNPAVWSSTQAVQATSGNVSYNTGPDRSEYPDSSQHRVPDVPDWVLSKKPSNMKDSAVRYYKSPVTSRSSYQETHNPHFEQFRLQIKRKEMQDHDESRLKASLDHAIQPSKLDTSQPRNRSIPPTRQLHAAQSDRLGPSAKDSSGYVPKSLTRQSSTNTVGEKNDTLQCVRQLTVKVPRHEPG